MSNTSATGGVLVPDLATPPLTDAALEDVFQSLLAGLTGLAGGLVRPRWQPTVPKQPEATTDWCAFGLTEDETDANPAITHDGDGNGGLGMDVFARHNVLELLVSFYGPNGQRYAKQVRDGMYVSQNSESLNASLIRFVDSGTIRNVPELVNEQWIRRYDLVMKFRQLDARTYPVENILSAVVDYQT